MLLKTFKCFPTWLKLWWALGAIIQLALVVVVLYIARHFILKYW